VGATSVVGESNLGPTVERGISRGIANLPATLHTGVSNPRSFTPDGTLVTFVKM
jgi:hypothetical protein